MTDRNLEYFLKIFENDDDLIRIKEYVNPILEITEITERICKDKGGGKAVLFENTGTEFPVAINIFGSLNRIQKILGVSDLNNIGEEIDQLFKKISAGKNSFLSKLKMLPLLRKISSWTPVLQKGKGICQEIVQSDPDLSILPILKCWPFDGGRFITLPMVITKDPVSGNRNVGMYRMQIIEKNVTGMHWQKYKTGRAHFEKYKTLNQKMPVAVAIGGDPIYTYSATAPLPENVDEFVLAGFLRKKKVKLVKCITQDIEVPADADFILEGYVDPDEELFWEGPFGDHTGFYSLADWFPKFHVTCITHKKNAIYPATIVGPPPMEDAYIAKATERIFLSPMKMTLSPEIIDINLPFQGVAHNIAVIQISKTFKGQGAKVMHSMWGAGQMAFTKILIIVSEKVKITDYTLLLKFVSDNVDIKNNIHINKGVLDELDHASNEVCYGGKLCIDTTDESVDNNKINLEKIFTWKRNVEEENEIISDINIELVNRDIACLIVGIKKKNNIIEDIKCIINDINDTGIKFIIFIEDNVDINDYAAISWIVSANIDPARDCVIEKGILAIDATRKIFKNDNHQRSWPNVVVMDNETIIKINSKWKDIGINDFIESPSVKRMRLNTNVGDIAKTE